jgi:hypothetical protein
MEMIKTDKKAIVITSIFEPTEAVQKFSKLNDCQLIVVGDKKTPDNWNCDNTQYLSIDKQKEIGKYLNDILPFNHYCRKMMGYIYAIKSGAEFIVDTDDDNIPKDNWSFPDMNVQCPYIRDNMGFVNIYQYYTDKLIWPRGLPLNLINNKNNLEENINVSLCNVGVWQGLADEDPDVDAIYRLTSDVPCYFNKRGLVVLGKGTVCPFNTQNTIIRKELFPIMYLPAYVTFRFTDILRGLIAQPIMWLYDYHLGFTNATVVQKRNPHDYMKDFISEIPMYVNSEKVIEIVSSVISKNNTVLDNMYTAYEALFRKGIVEDKELPILEAWLKEI